MRHDKPVQSKRLVEQYLASSILVDQRPAIFRVKRAGTRSGAEIGNGIADTPQCFAGHRKKRPTDTPTLKFTSDEQRPNPAVADIASGKRLYCSRFLPNPDFRPLDELSAIIGGDQIRVGEPVLANRVPDLHDPSNIALYGSPNSHVCYFAV